jgi:hypothetical protein
MQTIDLTLNAVKGRQTTVIKWLEHLWNRRIPQFNLSDITETLKLGSFNKEHFLKATNCILNLFQFLSLQTACSDLMSSLNQQSLLCMPQKSFRMCSNQSECVSKVRSNHLLVLKLLCCSSFLHIDMREELNYTLYQWPKAYHQSCEFESVEHVKYMQVWVWFSSLSQWQSVKRWDSKAAEIFCFASWLCQHHIQISQYERNPSFRNWYQSLNRLDYSTHEPIWQFWSLIHIHLEVFEWWEIFFKYFDSHLQLQTLSMWI